MAKRRACRIALLVPDSCAHIPISARSFHGYATDDRKSLLASMACEFRAAVISFQSRYAGLDPTGQRNPIYGKGCKEMHMVWHYNIATNSTVTLLRLDGKGAECRMNFIACQQALTFVSVKCHEVERPHIIKQTTEARRTSLAFFSVIAQHG